MPHKKEKWQGKSQREILFPLKEMDKRGTVLYHIHVDSTEIVLKIEKICDSIIEYERGRRPEEFPLPAQQPGRDMEKDAFLHGASREEHGGFAEKGPE